MTTAGLKGLPSVLKSLSNIEKRLQRNVAGEINEALAKIDETIKKGMQASSPAPSKPGDYPARDTGVLMGSIGFEPATIGNLEGRVGSFAGENSKGVVYAAALEFGYEPRNLEARPFLRPSLKKHEAKITERIIKAAQRALKNA